MKNTIELVLLIILVVFIGCSQENERWKETSQKNSIGAYNSFIKEYPSSEFCKQAKTNMVKLMFSEMLINSPYFPKDKRNTIMTSEPNDVDSPKLWNGKPVGGFLILSTKLKMGESGDKIPIPGQTHVTVRLDDSSFLMEFDYSINDEYKIVRSKFTENSIVETKNGIKYTYRNGRFE
jgi:hypothetical protein